MRMVHYCFLVTIPLYTYTGELTAGINRSVVALPMLYAFAFLACVNALQAYYFRTKLPPAVEKLRRDSNDLGALMQWRKGTIVSLALISAIELYGFALRFLGAPRPVAWGFYVAAAILLLLWRPKLELPAGAAGGVGNQ